MTFLAHSCIVPTYYFYCGNKITYCIGLWMLVQTHFAKWLSYHNYTVDVTKKCHQRRIGCITPSVLLTYPTTLDCFHFTYIFTQLTAKIVLKYSIQRMWHLLLILCVLAIMLGWIIFGLYNLVQDIIIDLKELIDENQRKEIIQLERTYEVHERTSLMPPTETNIQITAPNSTNYLQLPNSKSHFSSFHSAKWWRKPYGFQTDF